MDYDNILNEFRENAMDMLKLSGIDQSQLLDDELNDANLASLQSEAMGTAPMQSQAMIDPAFIQPIQPPIQPPNLSGM